MKRGVVLCALVLAVACRRDTDLAMPHDGVGYDAYLAWDRWPALRINTRTIMRSTFDRAGGNEGSDASHFLSQNDRGLVALSVAGTGALTFVRANNWHGSPWRYTVDGRTTEVTESSTADPTHPQPGSTWAPAAAFPPALTPTWSTTNGADLSWVQVPFEKSIEIAFGRSHYGTGYFILQLSPQDVAAGRPLSSWDGNAIPPSAVSDLFQSAGTDIAPTAGLATATGTIASLAASTPTTVLDITRAGTLRALKLTVPKASAEAFAYARLRITWDGRPDASVDAPIGLFFGAGSLHNRTHREWLVKAFPVNVHFLPDDETVELATYFPMPFAGAAHIEIVSDVPFSDVGWSARWEDAPPQKPYGLFHATYRDQGLSPAPGKDLLMLDTNGIESTPAWCGQIVGTSLIFSDNAVLTTLEGDPRFFFDDSKTPQVQGTGTEEWGGGGDYWGGQTMTLPFVGHPAGAPSMKLADSPEDAVESAYRFLLGDAMPFGRRAVLQIEHGGDDDSSEHYRTVVFWYGAPEACLALSDSMHVGDPADEEAHGYVAVGGSAPYSVTSRYEVGVDHVGAIEVVPATTDSGRTITTSSELTLAVPPGNAGILLRRTLDYQAPDQQAEVWVRDANDPNAPFEHAATWLTAGSTSVLYANAPGETDVVTPTVTDSGRRWKDDEILLAPRFSQGKSALRVRIIVNGGAWTEFRYAAYAWSMPDL